MAGRFGAVLTAMATPFLEDGSLDLEGARLLARHLFEHGTEAIVAAGTTGESPVLSHDEKQALFETVAEVAHAQGKRVICGTGTFNTAESVALTQMAAACGADGILIVTPYYSKPPQQAIVEHFRTIADSTDLPIIAYNIPGRTGTRIAHDTLLEMAEIPNIAGVKDSTGDIDGVAKLIAAAPDGFDVYCGDDWATFAFVCLGGAGIISVAAHLVGDDIVEMVALIEKGEIAGARAIHQKLSPLYDALFCTSSPIPLKGALRLLGLPGGPLRPPLLDATDAELAIVEKALRGVGVL